MEKKKKRIILLIVLLTACGIVYLPFSIPAVIKLSFGRAFPGSRISVGKCSLKPPGEVVIEDIAINGSGAYEVTVEEITVSLNIISLLKGRIPRVVVREPIVLVTLGRKDIQSLLERIRPGRGGLIRPERLEVFRAHLNISSANLITETFITATYLPIQKKYEKVEVSIDHLRYPGFLMKGLSFSANQGEASGRLYIRTMLYNRMRFRGLEGYVVLKEQELAVENLRGMVFGGRLKGDAALSLVKPVGYQGRLSLEDVDFSRLIEELGFEKKIMATGTLAGSVTFKGQGSELGTCKGQLIARGPRGTFVITDKNFLERIAQARKQDLQIIMEAFKDYAYTRGTVNLSSEGDALMLQIYLDGERGKRDLSLNLHNFF